MAIKVTETWVQDADITEVPLIIMDMTVRNAEYIRSTGSKYVTGAPKNGNSSNMGIYFRDPTIQLFDEDDEEVVLKEIKKEIG